MYFESVLDGPDRVDHGRCLVAEDVRVDAVQDDADQVLALGNQLLVQFGALDQEHGHPDFVGSLGADLVNGVLVHPDLLQELLALAACQFRVVSLGLKIIAIRVACRR